MISTERFIILCFLTQAAIGLSGAQSTDHDDTTTQPPDFEINSEENKIEDGPFFFKINAKRNKPYTIPIIEMPTSDDFEHKTAWEVYNNEKTSWVEEKGGNNDEKEKAAEVLEAPDVTLNESTSKIVEDEKITAPERASDRLEDIMVEPIHQSSYIYFYKPSDSSRTSGTSPSLEKDYKDEIGLDHSAFSSLGFGYPFLDNILSVPRANIRIETTPKVYHTTQDEEQSQGFSSLGFGYPFLNNFYSLPQIERPIKRAVTKVKIFSNSFEDDQPTVQERVFDPSSSTEDRGVEESTTEKEHSTKVKESTKIDELKDGKLKKGQSKVEDDIKLKDGKTMEKSANVEEILSSILPIYDWATSSFLNMNMNQDILNIGNMLRNNHYGTITKHTDKNHDDHSKPQPPLPGILPDVEKNIENDTPEPRSFIEELMDEINGNSEENRELNIERPFTDKDLPSLESEGNEPKNPKSRSPPKCICGFSQGSTNSCSCFPQTYIYYQYCSVPLPPTD